MSSYPLWAGGHLFNLLIINHLLSTGDNKDCRAAGRVGGVTGGIAERLAEGTALDWYDAPDVDRQDSLPRSAVEDNYLNILILS